MKINNVFHPNLFEKSSIEPFTGKIYAPTQLFIVNKKEKWEVENIFDARNFQKIILYQVMWTDWDEDCECFDTFALDNSPEIVQNFLACYSNKSQA